MIQTQQLPLDLPYRASLDRDNFLVTQSNAHAVTWLDQWPNWPAPVLVIYGPPASGKTHLTCVWAQRAGATCLDMRAFANLNPQEVFESSKAIIVDQPDTYLGDMAAETFLFHLYNAAKEAGAHILMTMTQPPHQAKFALPDLRSRLCAAPAVPIAPPGDAELAAVLVKMFSDRQIKIPAEVLSYILPRMERSYAAARDLVKRSDKAALAQHKKITIPFMKGLLESDIAE